MRRARREPLHPALVRAGRAHRAGTAADRVRHPAGRHDPARPTGRRTDPYLASAGTRGARFGAAGPARGRPAYLAARSHPWLRCLAAVRRGMTSSTWTSTNFALTFTPTQAAVKASAWTIGSAI